MELNTIIQGDCLQVMKDIPDKSIDMILCDLPYGTTACSWDTVIPFEPLWEQYKRIVKDNAAIVLFGSQPFTTDLIMSNRKWFRYELMWAKNTCSNFMLANKMPLKAHENICIFYKAHPTYNPIKTKRKINKKYYSAEIKSNITGNIIHQSDKLRTDNFPNSIINISSQENECNNLNRVHPTQKPVDLLIYLIETYTNEGDLVLDNAAGSCSTAVACKRMGRPFIMIEQDPNYCVRGRLRLKQEYSMFEKL